MDIAITDEIVKVQPKTTYLSPEELTQLRNVDTEVPSAGLKRTMPKNTEEEKQELDRLYDLLQKQLSKPRIERLAGRALAVWDLEAEAVRVIRKDGKFGTFGYSEGGQYYLEYYEAMFLLEVNRLQLENNSLVLSVEQSYLLLMGEEQSKKFNEYLVYSHFTRVGYILVKHQNIHFQKHHIENEDDCVWAILDAELNDETHPDYVRKSQFYAKTKQQFDQIRNDIKNQKITNNEDANDMKATAEGNGTQNVELHFTGKIKCSLKRKAEDSTNDNAVNWQMAKRRRNYATNHYQGSLVDFLKDEQEYKQFKEQFEKFDIVPLTRYDVEAEGDDAMEDEEKAENDVKTLSINFDVYMHNDGFRKSSPHIPNFRVIILNERQQFPNHREMFYTHRKQLCPVPLLLVTVNDSKQIHAFLYYFS